MGLREDCKAYEDPIGVMLDKNKIIDGNALLYTGAKIVLLQDEREKSDARVDVDDFLTYRKMLAASIKEPGVLNRYGKPGDDQEDDDYTGLAAVSAFMDDGAFAKQVIEYGRSHWYCWDNNSNKFNLKHFFIRKPGWFACMKAAAKYWHNPIDQFWAFLDLISIVAYENGSSGTAMTYLRYKTYVRKCSPWTHPITRLGCVIFKAAYFVRHPLGIKETYTEYFGPQYPFSQLKDGTF